MPRRRAARRKGWATRIVRRETIAVLLVLVVVLGSIAAYYALALYTQKPSGFNSADIYASSSRGVVAIEGVRLEPVDTGTGIATTWVDIYASGFVIQYSGAYYVVTNFHVLDSLVNTTVILWNGDAYSGKTVGLDAYSDLGILTSQAPLQELQPLELSPSSNLRVGQPVVAIGNPYGYQGSITYGIVSQTGRTISYDTGSGSTGYPIADAIQFSAPINPGNSGGPLLSADGEVVGITTAGITGAEGLGFAIPSDTIIRELPSLVTTGKYDKHPYLGIQGMDMFYQLSQAVGANVTYGVLIQKTVSGGPAAKAGLKNGTSNVKIDGQSVRIGGDLIISIDGNRIVNTDSLTTYLERNTLPGQTIFIGIIRGGTYMTIKVTLGTRPPPTSS
jgi:S1-C subfamily serine protease